jgi:hypothetical protein
MSSLDASPPEFLPHSSAEPRPAAWTIHESPSTFSPPAFLQVKNDAGIMQYRRCEQCQQTLILPSKQIDNSIDVIYQTVSIKFSICFNRKIPWPSWLQCLVAAGNKPWKIDSTLHHNPTTPPRRLLARRTRQISQDRAPSAASGPWTTAHEEPSRRVPWPAAGASRSTRGRQAKQRKRRKKGVAGEQWKTKGLRQLHSGRPIAERRRRRHLQAAAAVTGRGGKWLENPNRPSLLYTRAARGGLNWATPRSPPRTVRRPRRPTGQDKPRRP